MGGASMLLIRTRRGPPPTDKGFATVFPLRIAAVFVDTTGFTVAFEGAFTTLLVTVGTLRVPPVGTGLEKTVGLAEFLFSFSSRALARVTGSTIFFGSASGRKTRPRGGRKSFGATHFSCDKGLGTGFESLNSMAVDISEGDTTAAGMPNTLSSES